MFCMDSQKSRFTFLIRPSERKSLQRLAKFHERSEAAMLRFLIRDAAEKIPISVRYDNSAFINLEGKPIEVEKVL